MATRVLPSFITGGGAKKKAAAPAAKPAAAPKPKPKAKAADEDIEKENRAPSPATGNGGGGCDVKSDVGKKRARSPSPTAAVKSGAIGGGGGGGGVGGDGRKACPFGEHCYRKSEAHRAEFSHPPKSFLPKMAGGGGGGGGGEDELVDPSDARLRKRAVCRCAAALLSTALLLRCGLSADCERADSALPAACYAVGPVFVLISENIIRRIRR
jgi:hypothetical protein